MVGIQTKAPKQAEKTEEDEGKSLLRCVKAEEQLVAAVVRRLIVRLKPCVLVVVKSEREWTKSTRHFRPLSGS